MNPKLERFFRYYNLVLTIVSVLAIVTVGLDWLNLISLNTLVGRLMVSILLVVFAADYLMRLIMAHGKARMLATNTFRLSALVPTDSVISPEHVRGIWRDVRAQQRRLHARWHHATAKFRGRLMRFLRGGGLIYYLGLSATLILIASAIYAYAEHTDFANGLWWAIVTATTVGYGDIAPHTLLGRTVAVVLMFTGIGLIGTLTSSITAYFTATPPTVTTPADELLKYEQLRQAGVISKQELTQQKNKLLH
ncbi:ion channel [Lacticaseibacillus nasuensis]|uniref:Potassium ion channel protein n=1 Tax=Lacticaseibacillus nasuensis JCM 17158 TaxID=1291734 RepID=A0A0R1JIE1_9LACO|nr:ion channel [Lacticaseibacillus nasuensis]KRK70968.1 Potassium ion channel protein [Lacticaseibacillus nasuensis JCM 17158]